MSTNHYQTLGVAETATAAEIRTAYLAKAQVVHPDRQGGSDVQMRAINTAWAVLGDTDKRQDYDIQLRPRQRPASMSERVALDEDLPESNDTSPAIFHMVRSAPTILVLVILAGLFLVSAFAAGDRGEPQQRPAISIEPGDCVTEAAGSVRRVPCDGSTTGIAVAIVGEAQDCIAHTGTHSVPMPTEPKFACIGPAG